LPAPLKKENTENLTGTLTKKSGEKEASTDVAERFTSFSTWSGKRGEGAHSGSKLQKRIGKQELKPREREETVPTAFTGRPSHGGEA